MRSAVLLVLAVAFVAQGCVRNAEVPNVYVAPTATPTPGAPAMLANPAALTLSASAPIPPNAAYPTVTITQQGAVSPPFVVIAQSTCLMNGNVFIVSTISTVNTSAFALQALRTGQCVLVFGGMGGAQLIVPVTVNP
jgi:hypothetical protein